MAEPVKPDNGIWDNRTHLDCGGIAGGGWVKQREPVHGPVLHRITAAGPALLFSRIELVPVLTKQRFPPRMEIRLGRPRIELSPTEALTRQKYRDVYLECCWVLADYGDMGL